MTDYYIAEPTVLRESSSGFSARSISEIMFENREIQCIGAVDDNFAYSTIRQLLYLQRKDSHAEITIYINSPGGMLSAGLMVYDAMKICSCPIRTVCIGHADRAAALIFASGQRRQIFCHGSVSLYDPQQAGGFLGYGEDHSASGQKSVRTREEMVRILAERTARSGEEIWQKLGEDRILYAEDVVDFGLADEILTEM